MEIKFRTEHMDTLVVVVVKRERESSAGVL